MDETIWALKDVSFEVKQGEVVGIIGRNAAAKTTLLKILSRITEPTEGYAEIHGRVGSLLEVGTGFHPELTGRENIYLNGAILGMKSAEIERKFDEMVAFAEIEKFMDTPVKYYSSGMYVRLAFCRGRPPSDPSPSQWAPSGSPARRQSASSPKSSVSWRATCRGGVCRSCGMGRRRSPVGGNVFIDLQCPSGGHCPPDGASRCISQSIPAQGGGICTKVLRFIPRPRSRNRRRSARGPQSGIKRRYGRVLRLVATASWAKGCTLTPA